jgi:hypothetical protein
VFLAGDLEAFMSYIDDDIEMNTAEHSPFLPQSTGAGNSS